LARVLLCSFSVDFFRFVGMKLLCSIGETTTSKTTCRALWNGEIFVDDESTVLDFRKLAIAALAMRQPFKSFAQNLFLTVYL
jgi:hypothetical protein